MGLQQKDLLRNKYCTFANDISYCSLKSIDK